MKLIVDFHLKRNRLHWSSEPQFTLHPATLRPCKWALWCTISPDCGHCTLRPTQPTASLRQTVICSLPKTNLMAQCKKPRPVDTASSKEAELTDITRKTRFPRSAVGAWCDRTVQGKGNPHHLISEQCIRDASSRCSDGAPPSRHKKTKSAPRKESITSTTTQARRHTKIKPCHVGGPHASCPALERGTIAH